MIVLCLRFVIRCGGRPSRLVSSHCISGRVCALRSVLVDGVLVGLEEELWVLSEGEAGSGAGPALLLIHSARIVGEGLGSIDSKNTRH